MRCPVGTARLDQTLGKPGMWLVGFDVRGQDRLRQKNTIMWRMARMEDKVVPWFLQQHNNSCNTIVAVNVHVPNSTLCY